MTLRIMFLDMFKLRRLPKSRDIPVQLPQPLMQRWIPRSDVPNITLEMLHVNRIEADDGGVQTNIRLGDVLAVIIRSRVFSQMFFSTVQRSEKGVHGLFVGFLRGGEAGLVDAVVDVVVGPVVCAFDVLSQVFGEKVDFLIFLGQEIIKFGIEHADDLAGFVADDFVLLVVVERGDGEAAGIAWVDVEVDVSEVGEIFM